MDEKKVERMLAAAAERVSRRNRSQRHVKAEPAVRQTRGRHRDVSAADIAARLERASSGKRKGDRKPAG
jgi:hypothetical protein